MEERRPAKIGIMLTKGVLGVGTATVMGGEDYPTVLTFLCRHGVSIAQGDSRETGYSDFVTTQLKIFFPGSGCGVIIENGKIVYTESGLAEIVGKPIEISPTKTGDLVMIVYDESPEDVSEESKFCLRQVAEALGALFAPSMLVLHGLNP